MTRRNIVLGGLLIAMSVALSGCFLGHFRGQTFAGDEPAASAETSDDPAASEATTLSVR